MTLRIDKELVSAALAQAAGMGKADASHWLPSEDQQGLLTDWAAAQSELPERAARALSLPTWNYVRYEQLDSELYFASVDSGQWTFLSGEEVKKLGRRDLEPALAQRLERCCLVLTDRNFDAYARDLGSRYFFLDEGPTLHILVVTHECNLACIYCQAGSSRSRREVMDESTARMAVERALETPACSLIIEFQGGEPLMNFPVVQAAVLHAEQRALALGKRVEFSLISNFTEVVRRETLEFLIGHNVSVCISLDGPPALHDANRARVGCYDVLRANIDLYHQVWQQARGGPPKLKALLTTTRPSLSEVSGILDTYRNCGIEQLSIRPLTPMGRARGSLAALQYTPREFLDYWQQVVEEVLRRRRAGERVIESHLELLLQKLFGNETGYMDLRSPCGAAIGQIVYDVDGGIYTCDEGRMLDCDTFRIGELNQPLARGLGSAKTRRILDASLAEQLACDYCAFKPFCGVCPVLAYADDGELTGNVLAHRRCEIYGGMLRYILRSFASSKDAQQAFAKILEEADW